LATFRPSTTTEAVAINTAELARARTAGEIRGAEAPTSQLREYTVTLPARDPAAAPPAQMSAQVQSRDERRAPAVVNAAGQASARATSPLMSDAARAAEHMKYEAEKRRRSIDKPSVVATGQASGWVIEPARSGDEERPAPASPTIVWSVSEQAAAPADAASASAEAMTRLGLSGRHN
jgi:hypothetical protein